MGSGALTLSVPQLLRQSRGDFGNPEALDDTSGCTLIAVALTRHPVPPPPAPFVALTGPTPLPPVVGVPSLLSPPPAMPSAAPQLGSPAVDASTSTPTALAALPGPQQPVFGPAAVWPGVTATIACAGDSRAVLCRGGFAVELSRDHKASRQDERARILAAGGMLIRGRVLGRLAGECA
jgi:serine/threonine protein phosphatase PrpC